MKKEVKGKNSKIVMDYVKPITIGKKTACEDTKLTCERFLKDLNNQDYDFCVKDAEFVIQLIEKVFVHVKGDRFFKKPFLLEPWEKFIIYNLLGFYHKNTRKRRFRESLVFIPRKNGKTPFVAALAWALAILGRLSASTVYIVANSLKQALESFYIIHKNIQFMGEVENFRVLDNNSEHSISRSFHSEEGEEVGSMRIEALASNPENQDGFNAPIVIADEMHAYKNSNNYIVMKQATAAYENGLVLGITTAGTNMSSFCYSHLTYCKKVLRGEVKDEQIFIFIANADNKDDYTNPVEHEKANPNYGVTIQPEEIMAEAMQAQNNPATRDRFLNKRLNIYTNALNAYFDVAEAQKSNSGYKWTLEELSKLPISWYGGADLSKMYDLTAAALHGRYNDVDVSISHGFIPIVEAQRKADEDNIPFFWWHEENWLTMTNTVVVDYEEVVKWFLQMQKKGFKIKNISFDKYNSRDFYFSMKTHKFKMRVQDQAYWKLSEAFREIERKIKSEKYYYLNNKAFEYCLANVRALEDSAERVRFEKTDDNFRIDLFTADVIACKGMLEDIEKSKKMEGWLD